MTRSRRRTDQSPHPALLLGPLEGPISDHALEALAEHLWASNRADYYDDTDPRMGPDAQRVSFPKTPKRPPKRPER